MKKNNILIVPFYLFWCFSMEPLQANDTFSWLYDSCYGSCKHYVNEYVSSENFWKKATLFLVGLFAVKECATPVIKKTWQFFWQSSKEETLTNEEITILKNRVKQRKTEQQEQEKERPLNQDSIKRLFDLWMIDAFNQKELDEKEKEQEQSPLQKAVMAWKQAFKEDCADQLDQLYRKTDRINNVLVLTIKRLDLLEKSSSDDDWEEITVRSRPPNVPKLHLNKLSNNAESSEGTNSQPFSIKFREDYCSSDADDSESSSDEEGAITPSSSSYTSSRSSSGRETEGAEKEWRKEIYEKDIDGNKVVIGYKVPCNILHAPPHSSPNTPRQKRPRTNASLRRDALTKAQSEGDVRRKLQELQENAAIDSAKDALLSSGFWGTTSMNDEEQKQTIASITAKNILTSQEQPNSSKEQDDEVIFFTEGGLAVGETGAQMKREGSSDDLLTNFLVKQEKKADEMKPKTAEEIAAEAAKRYYADKEKCKEKCNVN